MSKYIGIKDINNRPVFSGNRVRLLVSNPSTKGRVMTMEGVIQYVGKTPCSLGCGYAIVNSNGFEFLANICNAELEVVIEEKCS